MGGKLYLRTLFICETEHRKDVDVINIVLSATYEGGRLYDMFHADGCFVFCSCGQVLQGYPPMTCTETSPHVLCCNHHKMQA